MTTLTYELNVLDANVGNTGATHDMALQSGTFTSNNKKMHQTYKLNTDVADNAEHDVFTWTNNKILATSTIIANASINVDVSVHTVVDGSCKVRITNKTGSTLADDSTLKINYVVI